MIRRVIYNHVHDKHTKMPGRKDKRERGGEKAKGGGGGLASFLGVGGMPDLNDDDLEAELLAMTGGSGASKGKKKGSGGGGGGGASMADIDKMLSSAQKLGEDEGDDDEDMDIDEADLLAELEGMEDDDDDDDSMEVTVQTSPPRQKPPPPAPVKPVGKTGSSGDLQTVNDRLSAYRAAADAAKAKGETSKIRRYERAITSMTQMAKDLKAGRRVNMEELPPEVFVPSSGGGGGGGAVSKGKPQEEEIGGDDLAELAEWAGVSSTKEKVTPTKATPTKATPSGNVSVISERLKMYQEGLKAAETAGDSNKARRYKRSIDTLVSLQKDAKSGRHVDMETLPPIIGVPATQTTPTSAKPVPKATPTKPDNTIDLDDPEFDEFNLSEEDMAAMMASLPELNKPTAAPTQAPPTKPTPPKMQTSPMKPKPPTPAAKPQAPPTSSRPPGLIDLDTSEFAEFDLSDEDMSLLAAQLDAAKNPQTTPPTTATPPVTTPPRETTQSLPPKINRPVGMAGGVTKEQVLLVLSERKDQYMKAVRAAKAKGDAGGTKRYGSVAIQFDRAIKSIEQGQPIDLSGIPPPPPGFTSSYSYNIATFKMTAPTSGATGASPQSSLAQGGGGGESDPAIPTPKTALEGLQQRLDKYNEGLKSAKEKNETPRVRRLGRIIKQYEEAIRDTKAGKFVNFDELPAPPGFPPIPPAARAQPRPAQSLPPSRTTQSSTGAAAAAARVKTNVNEAQLRALKQRTAEFQRAAREAKAKGDKEKALAYIRHYKGIEPMIAAAESGFPVDMTQVPPSPYSDPSKATASKGVLSHLEKAKEGDEETFDLIEKQLQEQQDICSENAKVYERLGNLGAASQYKNMADTCQRDLLAIKGIRKQGLTAPKFSMEMRKFAIVHSNPGLSDKVVEVEIVRGITIPCPSGVSSEADLNIYVELEFPWPSDATQKAETEKVKGTSNPDFNSKHQFDIDRKQMRSLQRVFKRQPLRCTVYQSRSLLRRAIFVGLALIPLETLETKCEVRASEDLKDEKGRRATGGKLEVYVRLREPLSGCDQDEREQKWLVFQEAIASEPTVSMVRPTVSTGPASSPIKVEQTTSLDALKLELSLVQNAIKAGKKDAATVQRGRALQSKIQETKQRLQSDAGFRREYLSAIAREIKAEKVYEQQFQQAGKTGEVKIIQGRRRVMENEIAKMQKK